MEEIERLKAFGHVFVISTGRALRNTLNIKGIEVFDYLSVLLGSCIYKTPNKQLLKKSNTMPKDEVKSFINYLNQKNIEWSYKDETDTKTYFDKNQFFQTNDRCRFVSFDEANFDIDNNHICNCWLLVTCLKK